MYYGIKNGQYFEHFNKNWLDFQVEKRPQDNSIVREVNGEWVWFTPESQYHTLDGNNEWVFERDLWLDTEIRPQRNSLLNDCDTIYCNADKWESMDTTTKQAWRDYKQELRDITKTMQFGDEFPNLPF